MTIKWHCSLFGHHDRFCFSPWLALVRASLHTVSKALMCDNRLTRSVDDMIVGQLAKLLSILYHRTARAPSASLATFSSTAPIRARSCASRKILYSGYTCCFPKNSKQTCCSGCTASRSLPQLGNEKHEFLGLLRCKVHSRSQSAEMHGGNIYSADWLVESVYLCS